MRRLLAPIQLSEIASNTRESAARTRGTGISTLSNASASKGVQCITVLIANSVNAMGILTKPGSLANISWLTPLRATRPQPEIHTGLFGDVSIAGSIL